MECVGSDYEDYIFEWRVEDARESTIKGMATAGHRRTDAGPVGGDFDGGRGRCLVELEAIGL